MNNKEPMTFEQWWSINSTPELIGQFEIRRYKGMTKENVLAVWNTCEAEQSKVIAELQQQILERDALIADKNSAILNLAAYAILENSSSVKITEMAAMITEKNTSPELLEQYLMSRLEVAGLVYNEVDGKTQFALFMLKERE